MPFEIGHKFYKGGEKGWFTKERTEGKKNVNWKGDDVSYKCLHEWVYRKLGKATKYLCEHCDKQAQEWANKSGNYKREISDWIPLCKSCHKKYDKHSEKLNRDSKTGRFLPKSRGV